MKVAAKVEALEEKSKSMNDVREAVLKNANLFHIGQKLVIHEKHDRGDPYSISEIFHQNVKKFQRGYPYLIFGQKLVIHEKHHLSAECSLK